MKRRTMRYGFMSKEQNGTITNHPDNDGLPTLFVNVRTKVVALYDTEVTDTGLVLTTVWTRKDGWLVDPETLVHKEVRA